MACVSCQGVHGAAPRCAAEQLLVRVGGMATYGRAGAGVRASVQGFSAPAEQAAYEARTRALELMVQADDGFNGLKKP